MTEKYYGWGLPIDISTHGHAIDQLIYIFHILMFVLFIGWFLYLVIALVKFRARPGHKAEYKEKHFKAPTFIEIAVAIIEAALLIGFSFPILNSYRNTPPAEDKSLVVHVIAEQFAWNIHYPGADGIFGKRDIKLVSPSNPIGLDLNDPAAKDDIRTINQLVIPVHKPVIVKLSSKDVIHSFFLPVARVKHDTIPGQEIPVWFETTQTGNFEIACAQLCGLGHYRMRGAFIVKSQEDFDAWLKQKAPKEKVANEPKPTPQPAPTQPAV